MISRDWQCLNRKCGTQFHSYDDANPPCPRCGCMRVSWIPGGGHIGKIAPRADASLRAISDQHEGMNLQSVSHSRSTRAAPRIETAPLSPELGIKHWGMGITSAFSGHAPVCVQAANPVHLTGKVGVGNNAVRHSASKTIPGPEANAIFAGRTRQRTVT